MLIPQASRTPRLLLRNGHPIILAEASSAVEQDASGGTSFTALGYRQTLAPAAKGGKANSNGFRFRNGDMRALARSFRGQVFIGGHDWGDPRARGGDIEKAWAEEMPGDVEMAMYFAILAKAPWAIEGLKNGTIDRFSLGASRGTEITCTVHNVPVWSISECWCFPGETVLDEDGEPVVAEWEHDGSRGLELSAVNVPAVDGTSILNSIGTGSQASTAILAVGSSAERNALEQMCGRTKAWDRRPAARVSASVPEGVSTPALAPITMASQTNARNTMDRALICQMLGLPVDATDEQIKAKSAELKASAAQSDVLRAQLSDMSEQRQRDTDNSHVEAEITRVKSSRQVSDKVVATLRKNFVELGRAAFDATIATIEEHSPAITLAPALGTAAVVQSSSAPAVVPGAVTFGAEGPDAFEANRTNANMPILMKGCGVTVDDIRKHGARKFNHEPKLQELVDNTAARGDRPGV